MIAANSWFLCTLVGLGVVPVLLLTPRNEWLSLFNPRNVTRTIATLLMFGLLFDHMAGLLSGELAVQSMVAKVSLVGFTFCVALAVIALWTSRKEAQFGALETLSAAPAVSLAIAMTIGLSLAIYAQPLVAWDARSIWFFHAKVIFFDHGLHPSTFWSNDSYDWSHKYYPKLTAMLAARYADFTGTGWNEYAPKGALVPLAVSSIVGLLAINRTGPQFFLSVAAVLTVLGDQLWNGYQDGWLALYGCIAICAVVRWSSNNQQQDLMLGILALATALCLKNEGQLLFVVALVPLLYGALLNRERLRIRDLAIAISFLPFVVWILLKPHLPAGGGLESTGLVSRAIGVIFNWPELVQRLFFLAQRTAEDTFLLESFVAFLIAGLCLRLNKGDLLVGIPAVLYTAGLIVVYLGTPYDFEFHVVTSLDRVALFPTLLLLIGLIQMTPRLCAGLRYVNLRALATRNTDNT